MSDTIAISSDATPEQTPVIELSSIDAVREDVNAALRAYFALKQSSADHMAVRYADLWRAMEAYMLAGGKRIRPYLIVLAYQTFGGLEYDKIIRVATGMELLNQALLIHDDIIDRDFVRYGVDNVAGQFAAYYATHRSFDESDRLHYASGAALLAGDLAIADAFASIRASGFPVPDILLTLDLLQEAIFTVAGGELLDSETAGGTLEDTNTLLIAQNKTAIYSVVIPLLIGAQLAKASEGSMQALRVYGEKLGIAYQLADDLLGVFGDESVTGKTATGDLREGKHTYMMQETWRLATDEQRKILTRLFGKHDMTDAEIEQLREIIVSSGGKQECEDARARYANEASAALECVEAPQAGIEALKAFTIKATKRDS